jgi:hypothetical protein
MLKSIPFDENPEYNKWFQRDQLLLGWIVSSLSEEVIPYVVGLDNSYDVWQALLHAFGSGSSARQVQIHLALQELTFADKIMAQFLKEAKLISNELAAAGTPLGKAEFNANIFRLLPTEYHPIIADVSARNDRLSFHELLGKLIAHEILLQSSRRLITATVNMTSHSTFHYINNGNNKRNNNSSNQQQGQRGNRRFFKTPCQKCGLRNDSAKWCRNLYEKNTGTPTTNMIVKQSSKPFRLVPRHCYISPHGSRLGYPENF